MAISDRLNKLTTDITNAYTSIENKGGTIPSNKNTENMSTAISSIEVIESATAEGESLSSVRTSRHSPRRGPRRDIRGEGGQPGRIRIRVRWSEPGDGAHYPSSRPSIEKRQNSRHRARLPAELQG